LGIYYNRKPSWQTQALKEAQAFRKRISKKREREEEKKWLDGLKQKGGYAPQ
jgi:hypothetical protein